MTTKLLTVVDGDLAAAAWTLYAEAFADVNRRAAQRHLMYHDEFDQVMADERVTKVLILDDAGVTVGLATYANDLTEMPLIAPEFYEFHWPKHYAQQRIWYVGFVAVADPARKLGAFAEFFGDFYRVVEPADGLVSLDICLHNDDVHHLSRAISMRLAGLSGGRSRYKRVDAQSFYLYDLTGNTLGKKAA